MNEGMAVYLEIAWRILSIMTVLLVMTLLMGRRQMGELPVFDFIVAITIGAIAGADIADPKIVHLPTAFAIVFLALIQIFYSKMIIVNRWFGKLTTFEPVVVIQNGKILNRNLKKIKYSLDTMLLMLREKAVFDLGEVEFAIIEPNGKLTVQRKSQYTPVIPKDMKIDTPYRGMPLILIVEGKVLADNLRKTQFDRKWLDDNLRKSGTEAKEVFFAALNTQGELYVSVYDHGIGDVMGVRH